MKTWFEVGTVKLKWAEIHCVYCQGSSISFVSFSYVYTSSLASIHTCIWHWFDLSISRGIKNNLFTFNNWRRINVYTNSIKKWIYFSIFHEHMNVLDYFFMKRKNFEMKKLFQFMTKGATSYQHKALDGVREGDIH